MHRPCQPHSLADDFVSQELTLLADNDHGPVHNQASSSTLARKRRLKLTQQILATLEADLSQLDLISERYYRLLTSTIFRKATFEQLDTDDGYLLPGHATRIQHLARMIAVYLGKDPIFCDQLYIAARFHDLGLQSMARSVMHRWHEPHIEHSELREQLLLHVKAPYLKSATHNNTLKLIHDIILEHHERWDGLGYPHQKKHKQISLAARIVAVAHFYDELVSVSPKSQREPLITQEALDLLSLTAGVLFDPLIVRVFCDAMSTEALREKIRVP